MLLICTTSVLFKYGLKLYLSANPNIVKILHGAANDVMWIQRDFSLYLVNIFDTYFAAKTLQFPKGCLSLAFLLQHYCNVKSDKTFQLADWRIRPLAEQMLKYARSDTRYLIKIFHLMKNALIEAGNENNNLLLSVYDQSTDLCRQRYEKPQTCQRPDSYLKALRRSKANFNSRQLCAYKEIFHWRDNLARQEDESEMYVLPPHMLLKIASELPREMQGILACCNPVPPFVKQNLHFLHQIVFKAREQPLTSVPELAITNADLSSNSGGGSFSQPSTLHVLENPLKCPLDLSKFHKDINADEPADRLNVLLSNQQNSKMDGVPERPIHIPFKVKPAFDIFAHDSFKPTATHESAISDSRIDVFLSPFQRLQLLKPYMEAMSIKQEESSDDENNADDGYDEVKEED